jgi:hypothetical protein
VTRVLIDVCYSMLSYFAAALRAAFLHYHSVQRRNTNQELSVLPPRTNELPTPGPVSEPAPPQGVGRLATDARTGERSTMEASQRDMEWEDRRDRERRAGVQNPSNNVRNVV